MPFFKSFLASICRSLINREGWRVVYVKIKFLEEDMLYDNIETNIEFKRFYIWNFSILNDNF